MSGPRTVSEQSTFKALLNRAKQQSDGVCLMLCTGCSLPRQTGHIFGKIHGEAWEP